jgi:sugar fermentation stimulation protein A
MERFLTFEPALRKARLLRRYKRFLADLETGSGERLTVHCPNTGAMLGCDEPGSEAWYSESANPRRKYRHTLEVVVTGQGRVGVNTGRANTLVRDALHAGVARRLSGWQIARAEVAIPDEAGRFDLLLSDGARDCYVEVKNMTLCDGAGRGSFPDAVSTRAVRHVRALARRVAAGDRAVLIFCAQHTGVERATLADEIHPEYGAAVREAVATGVEVLALGCRIEPGEIRVVGELPVDLAPQCAPARKAASVRS